MPNLNKIKKYSRIGLEKIKSTIRTNIFLKTGRLMPRPQKVQFLISNKCNYRCQMCPQWKRGESEKIKDYISTDRVKKIIDEVAKSGIPEFGISGGEPLLFKENVLDLLKYANQKNLYTHFVTNGLLLNKELIQSYNDIGGGHISLSIDSFSEKHDELRGYKGAFESVKKVIDIFEKNTFPNIKLKINTVISNKNLEDILVIVELAIKNKFILFIQPFDIYDYSGKLTTEEREEKYPLWVEKKNYSKLKELIERLLVLKKDNPGIILNSEAHLRGIYRYFTGTREPAEMIGCTALLDRILINPDGKIWACKFGSLGDLKKEKFSDFLKSQKRKKFIEAGLKCQAGCMLGCAYRLSVKDLLVNGPKQFLNLIK